VKNAWTTPSKDNVARQVNPRAGQEDKVPCVRDHAVHQACAVDLQMLQHLLGRLGVTLLRVAPVWPGAPLQTGFDLDLPGGMQQLAAYALIASRQRAESERRGPTAGPYSSLLMHSGLHSCRV
jgi:hypothetical protein